MEALIWSIVINRKREYRETVKLSKTFLLDLSPDGPCKLLKPERIQECLSLLQAAKSHNAELIVNFSEGERFIHSSVYDIITQDWAMC